MSLLSSSNNSSPQEFSLALVELMQKGCFAMIYSSLLSTLIVFCVDSALPCFAAFGEQTANQLRDRFQPALTHSLVGEYVNGLIDSSLGSNWTRLYDSVSSCLPKSVCLPHWDCLQYQYYSQSILWWKRTWLWIHSRILRELAYGDNLWRVELELQRLISPAGGPQHASRVYQMTSTIIVHT